MICTTLQASGTTSISGCWFVYVRLCEHALKKKLHTTVSFNLGFLHHPFPNSQLQFRSIIPEISNLYRHVVVVII